MSTFASTLAYPKTKVDIESMVMNDDILRPRATLFFKKTWADQPYDFPNLHINAPLFVFTGDARSTRSDIQNILLTQRHFNK
jgi:hypothetical protein